MGFKSRDKAISILSDLEKDVRTLRGKAESLESTEFYLAFDHIKKKFEAAEAEAFDAWQTHHVAEALTAEAAVND